MGRLSPEQAGEPGPCLSAGAMPHALRTSAWPQNVLPSPHPGYRCAGLWLGRPAGCLWGLTAGQGGPWVAWPLWPTQLGDQDGSYLPWSHPVLIFEVGVLAAPSPVSTVSSRLSGVSGCQAPSLLGPPQFISHSYHLPAHLGCGCFLVAQLGSQITQLRSLSIVWVSLHYFLL